MGSETTSLVPHDEADVMGRTERIHFVPARVTDRRIRRTGLGGRCESRKVSPAVTCGYAIPQSNWRACADAYWYFQDVV